MKLYLVLLGVISFLPGTVANAKAVVMPVGSISEKAVPVTGVVTDETGKALSGVSVKVKGTGIGQTTDENGRFRINAPSAYSVLVISYVGYASQEVPLNGSTEITVQLKQASSGSLSEVVVVGYGSQRRATVTGAISSVNAATVTALPVAGIDQALQGRVAGLNVTNNGSPGSSPLVTIRGISSVSFASDPLYVVDGFPLTTGLQQYDAKDIDRVDVLKDASTAAIYGSRATNGVIIVTTKKGSRNGKVNVTFDSYAGIQSPIKKLDLLNTDQYIQYAKNLGVYASIDRFKPANFNAPIYAGATQTYAQTNTDWQDEYFIKNALLTGSNVGLSGGNDVSRFHTSAGYFKQNGIAQALNFERLNYRINSDHIISKVFTFGQNLYTSVSHQRYDPTLAANRTSIVNLIRMQPYIPVYDPTKVGGFQGPISSFDGSDPINPIETALVGNNRINSFNLLGSAYLDVNILSSLKFRSTFGVNYLNNSTYNYTPIFFDGGTGVSTSAPISYRRQSTLVKLFTQQLNYDKTFDKHHLGATAVFETQSLNYNNQIETGNQSSNLIKTLVGASNVNAENSVETNFLVSYVGRVNYDYAGKYLFQASIRRDGLSIWAPGKKYANFPAASIGWKIDQEDFLKSSKTVSELKLRASYGVTGINPNSLGNYPYLAPVQANNAIYPFLNNSPNSSYIDGITNAELEWEKTKQLNIGVDFGILNNKFTLTAEFFRRQTDNLMIVVPTAPSLGYLGSGTLANAGGMRNTGVELQLGYHKTTGDFKYDITGLISAIRNKVLFLNTASASIPSGNDADLGGGDAFTNTRAGESVQYFYGWVSDGIFQNAAQVASSPTQSNAAPGDIKFKDLSGPNGVPDGVIDNFDRTRIGSFLPNFTYSLNYSASYKNFDASVFFQGVQGNEILNTPRIIMEGMTRLFNAGTNVLNAWTPSNTNTDMPRATTGDLNRNSRISSRWIEDGSYLRLKNVILGYTLPANTLTSISGSTIKRLRVFVSSTNLVTFTGYKGYDPEIGSKNGTLTNGVDFGQYPSARSFQFGIQAGF
ncbi:SusC/RagA family TonB-linked outer membrane protein [Mucilaginibacter galii]|nr:TonB-dependent receptor [Mucilaginibacter galii]